MQLIQIGQTPAMTLQQLIEEMGARQFAEIEQLKQAALERHAAAQLRSTSTARRQQLGRKRLSVHMMKRAVAL
jgi:hypothetical protein